MATDEAYEAACTAATETYYNRTGLRPSEPENYAHVYARAAVDAVWDLAVAEGRRQAAEAIRADKGARGVGEPYCGCKHPVHGFYCPVHDEGKTPGIAEWAARIAAGETP
jgi:hypothetical protein